jgi:hypothetical protein
MKIEDVLSTAFVMPLTIRHFRLGHTVGRGIRVAQPSSESETRPRASRTR